jgi:hypothetical protein
MDATVTFGRLAVFPNLELQKCECSRSREAAPEVKALIGIDERPSPSCATGSVAV